MQKPPGHLCSLLFPGIMDYTAARDLQLRLVQARRAMILERDIILFLEHPPVFTLGRQGKRSGLLVSGDFLASRGIPVVHVERGGDITYHGPGQLVIYPIMDLRNGVKVSPFVHALEEVMIGILKTWGIRSERNPLNRGVWIGMSKIGSLGIAIRRSISFHGLALNVNTDMEPFQWIHPCGLQKIRMTSMREALGEAVRMDEVYHVATSLMQEVFGLKGESVSLEDIHTLLNFETSKA